MSLLLLIFLLCASIISVIFYGIQQFKLSSQLASINQVSHLSHLLVRQQADIYAILLRDQNTRNEQLLEHLEHFTQQEFVLDASLYSHNGELLAQTQRKISLSKQLQQPNLAKDSQQIVETIYSADGVIGFLRVTFNNQYGQTTQHKINQIFHQLYGEFVLILLVGILLASSLHYFLSHYRRIKHKQPTLITRTINQTVAKTAALSYHRRRRRTK